MEKTMKALSLASVLAVSTLSGCATIATENNQNINVVTSNGKNVQVTVEGKTFQAPGLIQVTRDGSEKVITTSAEGCAASTAVTKKIEPMFFGNVIIGGVLGSSTDAGTGKMWNYAETVSIACTE
ncbi:adenosine deaminase [Psychrosphaera ytuae]|nr:adenosine deaminase [Psychrosphaera ytuae]